MSATVKSWNVNTNLCLLVLTCFWAREWRSGNFLSFWRLSLSRKISKYSDNSSKTLARCVYSITASKDTSPAKLSSHHLFKRFIWAVTMQVQFATSFQMRKTTVMRARELGHILPWWRGWLNKDTRNATEFVVNSEKIWISKLQKFAVPSRCVELDCVWSSSRSDQDLTAPTYQKCSNRVGHRVMRFFAYRRQNESKRSMLQYLNMRIHIIRVERIEKDETEML